MKGSLYPSRNSNPDKHMIQSVTDSSNSLSNLSRYNGDSGKTFPGKEFSGFFLDDKGQTNAWGIL